MLNYSGSFWVPLITLWAVSVQLEIQSSPECDLTFKKELSSFASLETQFQNDIEEDSLSKSCQLKITHLHILVPLSKPKMEKWETL